MIVYPTYWKRNYDEYGDFNSLDVPEIVRILFSILEELEIRHLAYSGGIDSTIILSILSYIHKDVYTYTISSREDHPDAKFARLGANHYNSHHNEFIVEPTQADSDEQLGDNAVRQFYECVSVHTDNIICGDGVDEFMCGYYKHQDMSMKTYMFYLSVLCPYHLVPLNSNSKEVKVYLPYLDDVLIEIFRNIPLHIKVDHDKRKKVMIEIAKYLYIPDEFIERNKYGFCDAFIEKDKKKT